MRSIWKGSIAFGLVNVPIKVYSATEDHDIALHQVHDEDGGRIHYKRVCEYGHDVDYEHIQRAYEDGDRTIVLTPEELGSLPEEQTHEIEVLEFVPSEQVDPIAAEKSYYLEPDSKSPKAYVLLRKTLEQTDRTAIVHFTLRQKTRLGALRVRGDVLVLQGLLWGDEVRAASFPALDTDVKVSANELKMSSSLVASMSTDFEPDNFTDDYQVELRKLIDAKIEAGEGGDTSGTFADVDADKDEGDGGDVIDLMAALRASVERNRAGGRGAAGGSDDDAGEGRPAPATKRAASRRSRSGGGASGDEHAAAAGKPAAAGKAPAAKKPAASRAKKAS